MDGIRIEVTGNIARVIEKPTRITAGTVGLPVGFSFDNQWEGLDKTAVFKANRTCKIVGRLEEETVVPWEVLEKPGAWLSIGVYGVSKDGSVAIPTIWANVSPVSVSAHPEGDPAADPSLLIYQELMNDIGNPDDLNTNAKDNLVEAINEVHNIALSGGIETDETLSESGKAAEAKATGEAIETAKRDAIDYAEAHINQEDNPHGVTADQVGLGSVDNTPDAEKPVSTKQAKAIDDAKAAAIAVANNAKTAADNAQKAADNAQNTANSAVTAAANAQTTANNALPKSGGTVSGALTVPTPTASGHAATKGYVDGKSMSVQISVPASGWSGSGPYTQTVTVSGLLATDRPHLFPVYSTTNATAISQQESWAMVSTAVSGSGSLTLTCFESKPVSDLTLQLEVNR